MGHQKKVTNRAITIQIVCRTCQKLKHVELQLLPLSQKQNQPHIDTRAELLYIKFTKTQLIHLYPEGPYLCICLHHLYTLLDNRLDRLQEDIELKAWWYGQEW
jgi:hypothetical protein